MSDKEPEHLAKISPSRHTQVSNARPIPPLGRRALLRAASRLALAAFAAPLGACAIAPRPRFTDYPFGLGVASGQPAADGFVIWTRLAPDPLVVDPRQDNIPVRWEVAEDARFRRVVRRGTFVARATTAHAVHVELAGLGPARPYWYRFESGGEVSPIGRTRTFPPPGAPADRIRFAAVSCQHYEHGYYAGYRDMVAQAPDLIVHLGDYIYENRWAEAVRRQPPEPYTLDQYRAHYGVYKSDPDLRAAHAIAPWAMTWDDHEVDNDYAGPHSQDGDPIPVFLARRAAAYQAYYEHMPLRAAARPAGPDMRLYTRHDFGDLVRFSVLDGRQYRSDHPCAPPDDLGGATVTNCAELHDESRTFLGFAQERWLDASLAGAPTAWNAVCQQTRMTHIHNPNMPPNSTYTEPWDGYQAARRRLLGGIAARGIEDVVVLSGDLHQFWVADLKADSRRPDSPVVATEFITSSITSRSGAWNEGLLPVNPHVRFFDWRHRGYLLCDVTPALWTSTMRVVDDVTDRQGAARTLAAFAVERGVTGALVA